MEKNIVIIFILIFIIAFIRFGLEITFIYLNSFVMTKKQAEKIKKKNQSCAVELIDVIYQVNTEKIKEIGVYETSYQQLDEISIYYVVKDLSSNKLYCMLGQKSLDADDNATNVKFGLSYELISHTKKRVAQIIKKTTNDEIKLNDRGMLWIGKDKTKKAIKKLNNKKLLEKRYKGHFNYSSKYESKVGEKDFYNLNTNNDYSILKECQFITGVLEF